MKFSNRKASNTTLFIEQNSKTTTAKFTHKIYSEDRAIETIQWSLVWNTLFPWEGRYSNIEALYIQLPQQNSNFLHLFAKDALHTHKIVFITSALLWEENSFKKAGDLFANFRHMNLRAVSSVLGTKID